jgi:NAD-dependent DNA ligase
MLAIRILAAAAVLAFAILPAAAADEVVEAIEAARKAYQAGDLGEAKQNLDLASQLIGQKNAEGFAALLPNALPGWKAEKAESSAIGAAVFGGASTATRRYSNAKGDNIEIQITGDSAMIAPMAQMLSNPQFAGAMGKITRVGSQRAIVTNDGDVQMVVANKFLVVVNGSGSAADKLAYAQAIDIAKLSKM